MNHFKGYEQRRSPKRKLISWKIRLEDQKQINAEMNHIRTVAKNLLSKQQQPKKPGRSFTEYVSSHKFGIITRSNILECRASIKSKHDADVPKCAPFMPTWEQALTFSIDKELFNTVFSNPKIEINEASLTQLIKDAQSGMATAQYQLADCYQRGIGVPVLASKAFHYYQMAANQGHAGAQIELGILYQGGLGVEQSSEKAFHYYKLAADQGHRLGLMHLGKCYEKGIGVPRNQELAFRSYQTSVSDDDFIGIDCVAHCYQEGIGVKKSDKHAAFYYNKYFTKLQSDADKGDTRKQVLVGIFFEKGLNVKPSMEKAIHYYSLAEKQNDPMACFLLASCYAYGKGIPQSLKKAREYYQRAADLGNTAAQLRLGRLLLDTDQKSKAFELFKIVSQTSSDADNRTDAYCMLAECFEKGFGVEQSSKNALHYYELAAKGKDREALCRLGKAYQKGELEVTASPEKAFQFYEQAAEQNDGLGQYYLAKCYENGIGVEVSVGKAIYFYRLSATQELKSAQLALDRLLQEGNSEKKDN